MKNELHSFVVPVYGQSPYLRECLESLRAQTLRSPIVISSSTPYEGLRALAEEFDARLVLHSPNAGIGRDWNFALSQSTTPWATVAHQDDLYLPTFAERTVAQIKASSSAVLVLTGYAELFDGQRRANSPMLLIKRILLELGFLGRERAETVKAKRRTLWFGSPIPCPSVTLSVSRAAARFREDLKVNLDWEAWLRLASEEGAFAYDREILMLHRIHASSQTSAAIHDGVRSREDLMMFESIWPPPIARILARAYTFSYETGQAS
ncbi:glycosyltransferase family 2 protein [Luteimonas salinilitoris]|uniref:Glycosyltransferase family 2 protein n=1 Tax=Luteimonas salinilitoris TaxID=3237697 RepID=A0ABV4HND3_9GAMM